MMGSKESPWNLVCSWRRNRIQNFELHYLCCASFSRFKDQRHGFNFSRQCQFPFIVVDRFLIHFWLWEFLYSWLLMQLILIYSHDFPCCRFYCGIYWEQIRKTWHRRMKFCLSELLRWSFTACERRLKTTQRHNTDVGRFLFDYHHSFSLMEISTAYQPMKFFHCNCAYCSS